MKNQNQSSHHPRRGGNGGSGGGNTWKMITICLLVTIIPWALYVNFHPQIITLPAQSSSSSTTTADAILANQLKSSPGVGGIVESLSKVGNDNKNYPQLQQQLPPPSSSSELAALIKETTTTTSSSLGGVITNVKNQLPVLGPVPMNGAKPLYELQHKGTDGIFALACNYPKVYYQRFVGSLRKFGYTEDIVLAVSPQPKMKPGVNDYLKKTGVLAYEFDVDCQGKDDCKLKDEFLGYPDPRPYRTFANIRYALYEYWLNHYSEQSYILILDFRDTFFQANPFQAFGSFTGRRKNIYDLQLYAENYEVKNIGICVFNSNWIKTCFGRPALDALKKNAVICSGSTLGSYLAINHYVRTMLTYMDSVKCWLKGIESDQGYQNYLYYNGMFNTALGNATLYMQGYGVVNTIGAMNGYRVPKEKKGPLGTFWKARDEEGYVINKDGSRSACVHQWDRWFDELHGFIDKNLFD